MACRPCGAEQRTRDRYSSDHGAGLMLLAIIGNESTGFGLGGREGARQIAKSPPPPSHWRQDGLVVLGALAPPWHRLGTPRGPAAEDRAAGLKVTPKDTPRGEDCEDAGGGRSGERSGALAQLAAGPSPGRRHQAAGWPAVDSAMRRRRPAAHPGSPRGHRDGRTCTAGRGRAGRPGKRNPEGLTRRRRS